MTFGICDLYINQYDIDKLNNETKINLLDNKCNINKKN